MNQKNIIGLSGKAGSGKDTFGEIALKLGEELGVKVVLHSFAKALKDEVAGLFSFYDIFFHDHNIYGNQADKEEPLYFPEMAQETYPSVFQEYLEFIKENNYKSTYRVFLQWYGTEYIRTKNNDRWLRIVADSIAADSEALHIITDVRFKNEADYVVQEDGYMIRINTAVHPNYKGKAPTSNSGAAHSSENDLDDYAYFSASLLNFFHNETTKKNFKDDCKFYIRAFIIKKGLKINESRTSR